MEILLGRNRRPWIMICTVLLTLLTAPGCGRASNVPESLRSPDDVDATVDASRRTAIVMAAEKCGPAVVTINAVQTVKRRVYNPFYSPLWEDFFRDFAPFSSEGPYKEYEQEVPSMGSGFIFDKEGYIMTAEHVVHGADTIEVVLPDGRTFDAEFVGSDYSSDVAVLKIKGDDFPYVELGDSDGIYIGEWAIAVGNPFGNVVASPEPTVSVGVVSAKGRTMKSQGYGGIRVYDDLIQTDASINPGNSGGPLVNALGQAIGINVTIITTSGGSLGIGFAVPINRAREVAADLIEHGNVERAWIGVYVQEVTPGIAEAFGFPDDKGILISDIDEGGPAYRVNLRRGDVITNVNGKDVDTPAEWRRIMEGVKPGETINMKVRRGGVVIDGRVPTEEVPGP
jgi:serine protease Do